MEQLLSAINGMNARLGDVEKTISRQSITSSLPVNDEAEATEEPPTATVDGADVAVVVQQPQQHQPPRQQQRRQQQQQQQQQRPFAVPWPPLNGAANMRRRQPNRPQMAGRPNNVEAQHSRQRSSSRSKQTFIGKKVTNGEISWGGVEMLSHRYIGNVRSDVSAQMIEDDLKTRDINVISVEENQIRSHSRYKSFKLTVKRIDSSKIDDADFWPANVVIRRWHHPRRPQNTDDAATTSSTTSL